MAPPYDIMLSYRIIDTGAEVLGGDGTVVRVKAWLEAAGVLQTSRGCKAVRRQL